MTREQLFAFQSSPARQESESPGRPRILRALDCLERAEKMARGDTDAFMEHFLMEILPEETP